MREIMNFQGIMNVAQAYLSDKPIKEKRRMMKAKRYSLVWVAAVLLGLTACNEENAMNDPTEPQIPPAADNSGNVYITGDDFTWELGDEDEEGNASSIHVMTRSTLTITDSTAKFVWTPGDRVGILPDEGAQVWFEIPTPAEGEEVTNVATFDGGAWALKPTSDYAAYYPFVKDFDLDRTKVPVCYSGQTQVGNGTTDHIGAYDYQGAHPSTTNENGGVNFDFDHVGALVQLKFTPMVGVTVDSVVLSATEAVFPLKGTFDLTAENFAITPNPASMSQTFTVVTKDLTVAVGEEVNIYCMMPPVDLSGQTLTLTMYCGDATTQQFGIGGKNLQAAGGYTLTELVQPEAYTLNYESSVLDGLNDNLLSSSPKATKVKFVAGSQMTDGTAYSDANGIKAYIVTNGEWMEVHTYAKTFEIDPKYLFSRTYHYYFYILNEIDFNNSVTISGSSMAQMFSFCEELKSITFGDSFNTSNVTDMSSMFDRCGYLTSLDLSGFNTSNVTDMSGMFDRCDHLTSLDLSSFNTSNVTDMEYMFNRCTGLKSITFGDNFNTSKVTNMKEMFSGCSSLTSLDLSGFNASSVTDMSSMFGSCSTLKSITFGDDFNTSNVTNMTCMFSDCKSITSLDLSKFNTSKVTNMKEMFSGCSSLTSLDLSSFNASSVIDMSSMFGSCSALKSITFGDNFNASNVKSMNYMFGSCKSLTSLDLSGFNASSVTDMSSMFGSCSTLKSITFGDGFNTSNVKSMNYMFGSCKSLTSLDLSKFNTTSVTNMSQMFGYCSSLASLDLSSFNTSSVTSMYSMFDGCSILASLDLSSFTFITSGSYDDMFRCVGSGLTGGQKATIYVSEDGKNYIASQATELDTNCAELIVK